MSGTDMAYGAARDSKRHKQGLRIGLQGYAAVSGTPVGTALQALVLERQYDSDHTRLSVPAQH
eukprot:2864898-Rhodomonas_salina.2